MLIRRVAGQVSFAVLEKGGGSSSSSSTETTTQNYDQRVAVQDGIGISSSSSNLTVHALDGGAIEGARQIAADAIELAKSGASNQLEGFDKLLGLSGALLDKLLDANKENQALVSQTISAVTPLASAGGQALATGELVKLGAVVVGGYFVMKVLVK